MINFQFVAVSALSVVATATGCSPGGPIAESAINEWKSDHFNISVELPDGWRATHMNTPGDAYDRPDQTVAAFLNKTERCTYIIRLEPDASLDQLSVEVYVAAVKAQFEMQPGYAFLNRDQVNLHDGVFERLRFRLDGDGKKSVLHVCIHRDGEHLVTIQMSYPSQGENTSEVPPLLASFDNGVSLDLGNLSRNDE